MTGIRGRLRIISDLAVDARVNRRRAARVVDHVSNFAFISETDSDHVMEPDVRIPRGLNGSAQHHAGMLKDTVDPKAPGFMGGHRARYFV